MSPTNILSADVAIPVATTADTTPVTPTDTNTDPTAGDASETTASFAAIIGMTLSNKPAAAAVAEEAETEGLAVIINGGDDSQTEDDSTPAGQLAVNVAMVPPVVIPLPIPVVAAEPVKVSAPETVIDTTAPAVATSTPVPAPVTHDAPVPQNAVPTPVEPPVPAGSEKPSAPVEQGQVPLPVAEWTPVDSPEPVEFIVPKTLPMEEDSKDEPATPVTSPVAGTRGAKEYGQMKRAAKLEVNAQAAEKNLPRGQVLPEVPARANVKLEIKETPAPRFSTAPRPTSELPEDKPSFTAPGLGAAPVVAPRGQPMEVTEVRPTQVTNVFNDITERVVAFRRVGSDAMDVSLKPERDTEISLHLSLRNGQVEVFARMERGNFQTLQVHWGELQQTLSQQGIRVGELTQSALNHQQNSQSQTAGNFGEDFRREHQRPAPKTLDELPLGGSIAEPLKKRTIQPSLAPQRGWEMWA